MKLPLPLQSYQTYSVRENTQSLINMYAVQDTAGGKTNFALYPTPGLKNLVDLSGSAVIGMIATQGLVYVVYTSSDGLSLLFGSLTSAGVFTSIGTLTVSTIPSRVSIATLFDEILIATGSTAYHYRISTTTLAAIVSANFPTNCTQITGINGYFIALTPNTDTFYVSNQADGLTWSALQFASANTTSSNLVAASTLYQQLFLFTQDTTEIWYNTGNLFPFISQQGNFINSGCAAPYSVVSGNDSLIWLSRNTNGQAIVLRAISGNNVATISTDALHYIFSTYTDITNAIAYSYQMRGHEFYVLTFPADNKTWVYDTKTNMWHELQSYNTTVLNQVIGSYTRHRSNCYAFLNGLHIVGDYITGKLFILDPTVFIDDNTYAIPRVLVTPNFSYNEKIVSIYSLDLYIEPGQGLNTGLGSDPLIGMEISKDGGFTWGNQRLVSFTKMGQYLKRIKWNLLGSARNFVFRFTVTDPVKVVILGAKINTDIEPDSPAVNYLDNVTKDL